MPLLLTTVVLGALPSIATAGTLKLEERHLEAYVQLRKRLLREKDAAARSAMLAGTPLTSAHAALIERLVRELSSEPGTKEPALIQPKVPVVPPARDAAPARSPERVCRDKIKKMLWGLTNMFGIRRRMTATDKTTMRKLMAELDHPPEGVTLEQHYRRYLTLRISILRTVRTDDRIARGELAQLQRGEEPKGLRDCRREEGRGPTVGDQMGKARSAIRGDLCRQLLQAMRNLPPEAAARVRKKAIEMGCLVDKPKSAEAQPHTPKTVPGLFGDPVEAHNRALVRKYLSKLEPTPRSVFAMPTIAELRRGLRSSDPQARIGALRQLHSLSGSKARAFHGMPVEELLPDVLAILDGRDEPRAQEMAWELAREAACTLAALGVVSIEPLKERLSHGRPRTRYYAAEGLGHLGHRAKIALPALLAAANDPMGPVRRSAFEAIVDVAPEDAGVFDALKRAAASDKDASNRFSALTLLAVTRGREGEAAKVVHRAIEQRLGQGRSATPWTVAGDVSELLEALARLGDPGADALARVFLRLDPTMHDLAIHAALRGKGGGLPRNALDNLMGGMGAEDGVRSADDRERAEEDDGCRRWLHDEKAKRPHLKRPYPSVASALADLSAPGRSKRMLAIADLLQLGSEAVEGVPRLIEIVRNVEKRPFESVLAIRALAEFGADAKAALPALASVQGHAVAGPHAKMARTMINVALKLKAGR